MIMLFVVHLRGVSSALRMRGRLPEISLAVLPRIFGLGSCRQSSHPRQAARHVQDCPGQVTCTRCTITPRAATALGGKGPETGFICISNVTPFSSPGPTCTAQLVFRFTTYPTASIAPEAKP